MTADLSRILVQRVKVVRQKLLEALDRGAPIVVVRAPPGSGKTTLLLEAAAHEAQRGLRAAVATQTNSQADDICERMIVSHPSVEVVRFASSTASRGDLDPQIGFVQSAKKLPAAPGVVVGTRAKFGASGLAAPFDVLFVEEAWQMAWADFMELPGVAPRFVLIGDPGQIPPVVTVDVRRWETAPVAPHRPAPEVILADPPEGLVLLDLPATWRLPPDTVELVRGFYDFPFESMALPGERRLLTGGLSGHELGESLAPLSHRSVLGLTLPTPPEGPPPEVDGELAEAAVEVAETLLSGGVRYVMGGEEHDLEPEDVGLCASHRVMLTAMALALPPKLRGRVRVDTFDRWQGLERKVMIAVHPLSGVERPSGFDLDTGRLCVMASRHQVALIMVSRDHVGETLESFYPAAEQAPGQPDLVGRGHARHRAFWSAVGEKGRLGRWFRTLPSPARPS